MHKLYHFSVLFSFNILLYLFFLQNLNCVFIGRSHNIALLRMCSNFKLLINL